MNTALENDFGKIWTDGHSPYIFSALRAIPSQENLNLFFAVRRDLRKDLIKRFKKVYCILSFSECKALSEHFLLQVKELYDIETRSKSHFRAIVVPASQPLVEQVLKSEEANISFFNSFEGALKRANKIRSEELVF